MAKNPHRIGRAASEWLVRRVLRSGKIDRALSFEKLVSRHCADDPAMTYLVSVVKAGESPLTEGFIAEAAGVRAVIDGLAELSAGSEAGMLMFDALLADVRRRLADGGALTSVPLRDATTGLPLRILFSDRLGHAVAIANRQDAMVALIRLEFDLADARTYLARVICEIADRLVHTVREVDTVARIAEGEFAIVITNIHSRDDGAVVVEKLFEVLAMEFDVESSCLKVPFRIGISYYPPHGHDADALLAASEAALRGAQWETGKNVAVFEDA